jgi:hypothetical protein
MKVIYVVFWGKSVTSVTNGYFFLFFLKIYKEKEYYCQFAHRQAPHLFSPAKKGVPKMPPPNSAIQAPYMGVHKTRPKQAQTVIPAFPYMKLCTVKGIKKIKNKKDF